MSLCGKALRAASLALVIGGISLNADAAWTTVYTNNFDSGPSAEISGAWALSPVAGYAGVGAAGNQFSGLYLVNDTGSVWQQANPTQSTPTRITLTGLPNHTAISLSFLLAIRDSWDGSYYAPNPALQFANYDYFNVAIDGVKVFSNTFGFRTIMQVPGYVQSYMPPAGGLLTGTGGNATNLGGNLAYPDSAYDMGKDPLFQSIAHTGSSLSISFWADGPGWQGGQDESWAIDNLRVSLLQTDTAPPSANPIPEPGTLLLSSAAFLGMILRRRPRMTWSERNPE